jgi:hypothetical protein
VILGVAVRPRYRSGDKSRAADAAFFHSRTKPVYAILKQFSCGVPLRIRVCTLGNDAAPAAEDSGHYLCARPYGHA